MSRVPSSLFLSLADHTDCLPCFICYSSLCRPNYSGKSVYLHQVALIIVLAHIGSAVPAKRMRLAVVRRINGRLSSHESVTAGQSAFFEDVSQVSAMMIEDTKQSLNLIDEFGKGTSQGVGMALLAETLKTLWVKGGKDDSVTICVTHFFNVIKEPFVPLYDTRFAAFSMEVLSKEETAPAPSTGDTQRRVVQEGRAEDGGGRAGNLTWGQGGIVRTYRLLPGLVHSESRALQCAYEAGMPKKLLQRVAYIATGATYTAPIKQSVVRCDTPGPLRTVLDEVRVFLNDTERNQ